MARKLLIARLGAGTITVALCAALPGCNLAIGHTDCYGNPASRGMSSVECPDAASGDAAHDGTDAPAPDSGGDR